MEGRAPMAPDVGRVVGADGGLTFELAKALRSTSLSRLLTEVSMMSTTSWVMTASIDFRNSSRVCRRGPLPRTPAPGRRRAGRVPCQDPWRRR